jgi:glucose-6-phosphate 1-dehydrogenase
LEYLRFANAALAGLWDRTSVSAGQITMAEDFGDRQLFARQDSVEETWRIFEPLLNAPPPVHPYAPGSWGPEEAKRLVAGYGAWHGPWVAS